MAIRNRKSSQKGFTDRLHSSDRVYDPLVGELIARLYRVRAVLSKTENSTVYAGEEFESGAPLAIKTPRADDLASLEAFTHVANEQLKLKHDNIVRARAVLTAGRAPYLIMDLITGISLEGMADTLGRLKEEEVHSLLSQLCDALEYSHEQGFMHGNLDPGSVMLTEQEGQILVHVLSFGMGRPDPEQRTSCMAPERFEGELYTREMDVYSIGAIAFELMAGRPFNFEDRGETLKSVRPELLAADEISTLVQHATEETPAKRIASIEDFRKGLDAWMKKVVKQRAKLGAIDDGGSTADRLKNFQTLDIPLLDKLSSAVAKRGPVQSRKKKVTQLVGSAFFALLFLGSVGYYTFNYVEQIKEAWYSASRHLGAGPPLKESEKERPRKPEKWEEQWQTSDQSLNTGGGNVEARQANDELAAGDKKLESEGKIDEQERMEKDEQFKDEPAELSPDLVSGENSGVSDSVGKDEPGEPEKPAAKGIDLPMSDDQLEDLVTGEKQEDEQKEKSSQKSEDEVSVQKQADDIVGGGESEGM